MIRWFQVTNRHSTLAGNIVSVDTQDMHTYTRYGSLSHPYDPPRKGEGRFSAASLEAVLANGLWLEIDANPFLDPDLLMDEGL